MTKNLKTQLFCFDTHRLFTEEIRKKFDDHSRYVIHSFQTADELSAITSDRKENSCKIAIIGTPDSREQAELVDHLTLILKKADPLFGIILVCPPDKIEEIRKVVKFNIDEYIPQNRNFILRVHNTVKKIFSEYSIIIHKKRRNRSLLVVLGFLIFSILMLILARIKFPEFF
jgi:hypothetical protein